MKRFDAINPKFPHLLHGADYNPDQWKEYPNVIDEDFKLMQKANCNVMSVGIFAWATLEPEEGKYDFSFLDGIMDNLSAIGSKAMLATPSAARPRWLAAKYPEVLRMTDKRERMFYGRRHNHCYTSPVYREKVSAINRALAERYKNHEALLVWHISNEYGGECHCPLCQEAFRKWVYDRYNGDLDKLNHDWWAHFWSHTYTDWSQIESPSAIGETAFNALALNWKRFVTHQTADFIKTEIAPLRELTPDIPLTTNLMDFYQGLNYREIEKVIDIVSWDSYPRWDSVPDDPIYTARNTAIQHDIFRSLKNKPFMLMESSPGWVTHHPKSRLKRPGVLKLGSLQAVAHGSDTVQYFQWRKCRGGWEQHHGAVVDHCGHENTRVFKEVSDLGETLKKLDDIVGTYTNSEVAILYDWENRWQLDMAQGYDTRDKKYIDTLIAHYTPFWNRGVSVDVIGYEHDLSKYKLLIAPMNYMMTGKMIEKVASFVENGGIIAATYMLGTVNEEDLCYLGGLPGSKLKDVFGLWTEAADSLFEYESNMVSLDGKDYKAVDYCEIIHPSTARVCAVFQKDFYAGSAALCENKYGKGMAYYIAFRDTGDFLEDFYNKLMDEASVKRNFEGELPYGVTAQMREGDGRKYVFLENFNGHETYVMTDEAYFNMETKKEETGKITLAPYETKILRK